LTPATAETIRQRVREAGVVGAGGAGFPTHVKLQAQVEIFLVNAAECEPMLKVDQQLMAQQAARLVRGVLYGMTATGATEGIIALKEKYRAAIAALTHCYLRRFVCIFCLTSTPPETKLSLSGWRQGVVYRLPRCRSAWGLSSITCRPFSILHARWNSNIP
jgi:Na+-translocating ferredoxin:NAD+ oxidoreductase RnfC subunit